MEEIELSLKPNMKILIIRLGAVGDVIRTVPVLDYLHKNLKNPEICWIVEDRASNLLLNHPYLRKVYIVPRKKYYKVIGILKKIRKEKFDLVLDFHGILKSGLISFFTGIKKRIGFNRKNCKELNWIFNNIKIDELPSKITRIEKNFFLLKALFSEVKIPKKLNANFFIEKDKVEYVDSFLKKIKINSFEKFIIVNPFVSKAGRYKEWPLENYIEFLKISSKYKKNCFIITWGPGELDKAKQIVNSVNTKNVVLAPKTDMKQLAVLIAKSDLIITGDTGPMHLASVLNIPIIAIFGPSDVDINKPWGEKNIVIWKNVGCNPCRNKSCKDLKCLKEIKPEEVFQKLINFDYCRITL